MNEPHNLLHILFSELSKEGHPCMYHSQCSVVKSSAGVTFSAPYLRDRPRGLGLLQLPTGMSDERSGPILPGLYIAGNKVNEKPQTVPDVHLPGQPAVFSGR